MHKALRFYCNLGIYINWLILSIIFLPLCCLLAMLPERIRQDNPWYFWLTSWYGRMLLFVAGIRFRLHTGANLAEKPAVIIMNHTSALDIPLMEAVLGSYPRIWLSKIEYERLPFIGFLLHRLHVLIKREDSRQATNALLRAYRLAQSGNRHLVMFPEGTRHADETLHEFHKGFAMLAIKLQRPVVPIMVKHASKILSPRSWMIDSWRTPIKLVVGPALMPTKDQSPEQFALQVWEVCNDLHKALQ